LVEIDLVEPDCSGDQPVKDGPATLCGCLKIEARHYLGCCQIVEDLIEAPERFQRLVQIPFTN
jgi:hypothetical protein